MICPVTDRECKTNGCGEKCYKRDSLGYTTVSKHPINETAQLGIGAVRGSLSIKEVAAKYGEKVECMFYDYDDEWKKKTMVVNASLLKDMEQGAVKDCH